MTWSCSYCIILWNGYAYLLHIIPHEVWSNFLRPSHHPFVYSFFGLNTSATSSICLSCFKITVSDSERRLLNCQVWLRVIRCMVMQCAGALVALNKSEVPVDKLINCCAEPGKRIWVSYLTFCYMFWKKMAV